MLNLSYHYTTRGCGLARAAKQAEKLVGLGHGAIPNYHELRSRLNTWLRAFHFCCPPRRADNLPGPTLDLQDGSELGQQEEGQRGLVEERAPQAATGSVEATGVQAEEEDKERPASYDGSSWLMWAPYEKEDAEKAWRFLRSMEGKGDGGQQQPGGEPSGELPDFRDEPQHLKWLIAQLSSPDPRVQEAAAGLMKWLADYHHNHGEIVSLGGIPPLVSLLSSTDTAVQRAAVDALCDVVLGYPSGCDEVMKEINGISSLLRLLEGSNPRLQLLAATIIGDMAHSCGDDDDVDLAELDKAIPRLVGLLSSSDTRVQWRAVCALSWFGWKDENAHKLVIAIPPLVRLLDSGTNGSVASDAERVLRELAGKGETYQVAIVDAGAIPRLVALIGCPPDGHYDWVKKNALYCLRALAVHPSCQAAIVKADGIPPLLEWLTYDDKGRSTAAEILRDLSADSACQLRIACYDGIPRLVRMLDSPDEEQQGRAANILNGLEILAGNAANRVSIVEAGGIGRLVQLLSSSDGDVQESAVEALGTLALDAANQVAIAEAGAIPRLAQLLLKKKIGAMALGNLACNAFNQVAIAGQEGVIPKLVELLKDRSYGAWQREAAWALRNLALNAANQASIAEAGGIPPLVEILMSDSSDQDVLRDAAAALGNLAVNAANQEAIAEAGGIPPLIKLLSHEDTEVQQQAAAVLENLALNSANQVSIAQAGGIGILIELVSSSADAGVKEAAAGALGSLALNAKNKMTIELLKPRN